jgi:hypothetical protein
VGVLLLLDQAAPFCVAEHGTLEVSQQHASLSCRSGTSCMQRTLLLKAECMASLDLVAQQGFDAGAIVAALVLLFVLLLQGLKYYSTNCQTASQKAPHRRRQDADLPASAIYNII